MNESKMENFIHNENIELIVIWMDVDIQVTGTST